MHFQRSRRSFHPNEFICSRWENEMKKWQTGSNWEDGWRKEEKLEFGRPNFNMAPFLELWLIAGSFKSLFATCFIKSKSESELKERYCKHNLISCGSNLYFLQIQNLLSTLPPASPTLPYHHAITELREISFPSSTSHSFHSIDLSGFPRHFYFSEKSADLHLWQTGGNMYFTTPFFACL